MTAAHGPQQPDAGVAALVRDGGLAGRWRLDAQSSRVEFGVRHFWKTITVGSRFGQVDGEGTVGPGGAVTGQLVIGTASLNTGNK